MQPPVKCACTRLHPFRLGYALVCLTWLPLLALLGNCAQVDRGTSPADGPPTSPPSLTLILGGDILLGRGVAQALDGVWESAFAQVRPWLDTPTSPHTQLLVLANLESPLTAQPQVTAGYDLRAPPEAIAALRTAGFDALSLANNHALDAGQVGQQETIDTLRKAGILPWLAGEPVAMSSFPSVIGLALDDTLVPLDLDAAAETVAAAAAQAKVIVVSIHWGAEYQATPSPRQREIARVLSKAGASVIAGHGPHVLQPVEMVGNTLVAYSLGNLLFDQPYPVDCSWGAIMRVTIRGSQIVDIEAVPTVTTGGHVRPAEQAASEAIAERLGMTQDTSGEMNILHLTGMEQGVAK
jgi:poly-gamma-glutamate capsule biosynthesis protein CapA/YwtB (metallophosphatase superfamily)